MEVKIEKVEVERKLVKALEEGERLVAVTARMVVVIMMMKGKVVKVVTVLVRKVPKGKKGKEEEASGKADS